MSAPSSTANHAVLHAIAYRTGIAVPVGALLDEGIGIEAVEELLAKGVRAFSRFDEPLDQALRDCVAASLEAAQLQADDIGAVILVTESFAELSGADPACAGFRQARNQAYDLLGSLGLRKAALFCATFGGCCNFLQAAVIARLLVREGIHRHILLVAAERFTTPAARLMQEAVSLAGDGVATSIVSGAADHGTGFRLDFAGMAPYTNIVPHADMAATLLEMFRSMKHAAADCYDACRMQPGDFRWIVLGDYNQATTLTYSRLLGFPPERTFQDNVGRLGHIPFDPLINLADLATSGKVSDQDAVLLFLCGPIACGALAVTVCAKA